MPALSVVSLLIPYDSAQKSPPLMMTAGASLRCSALGEDDLSKRGGWQIHSWSDAGSERLDGVEPGAATCGERSSLRIASPTDSQRGLDACDVRPYFWREGFATMAIGDVFVPDGRQEVR